MTKVCEYPSAEKSILKIITLQLYCTDHFVKVVHLQYSYIENNANSFQLENPVKAVVIYLLISFNFEQLNNHNNIAH